MGFNGDIVLSSHTCIKELPQRFYTHFTDKIGIIRTTLQAGLNDGYISMMSSGDRTFEGIPLKELHTVDIVTVEIIIHQQIDQ